MYIFIFNYKANLIEKKMEKKIFINNEFLNYFIFILKFVYITIYLNFVIPYSPKNIIPPLFVPQIKNENPVNAFPGTKKSSYNFAHVIFSFSINIS